MKTAERVIADFLEENDTAYERTFAPYVADETARAIIKALNDAGFVVAGHATIEKFSPHA